MMMSNRFFRPLFGVRCLLSQVNGKFNEIHTLQHVPTSGNRLTAEPSGEQKHKTILALFFRPNSTTPDSDVGTVGTPQTARKREDASKFGLRNAVMMIKLAFFILLLNLSVL